ncbi:quinolinate synthase NadA [Candidatus Fermentibacterales bacterium]|nr:quinolinate synthase NadA [Candidatus Fermentibacterales bacterium]
MSSSGVLDRIQALRRERGALILAHCYQPAGIQDIADRVGDSLDLSRAAASSPEPVIVFCGVRFMAETAHILAPGKTVLLPDPTAGCPLADSLDMGALRALQEMAGPSSLTVMYVNSPAEAKAASYACCTSANALQVVERAPSNRVVFAPDRNLGEFVSRSLEGRKELLIYQGCCTTHANADLDDLLSSKRDWPDAEVLVHPETPPAFWENADFVLGTGGMVRRIRESAAGRFLIGTERGMIHRLETLYPERSFRVVGSIFCPNMKKVTLEAIERSLATLSPAITLPAELRERALRAVRRMAETG